MPAQQELSALKKIIADMGSALVAFSGGTDSTFLLKVASSVLPRDKVLAVTAVSETYPAQELSCARRLAADLKVKHKLIRTHELRRKKFVANSLQRCYFCKKELFSKLRALAKAEGLAYVLDASNISDKKDFRPGSRAAKEFKVRSVLQEAGLTKERIRDLSRGLGLVTWDKPALACLASRVPYGEKITPGVLKLINRAESYLRVQGLRQVRVRHYGGTCSIEVLVEDFGRLIKKSRSIVRGLKELGYQRVTLDLEGYRTGSLNPPDKIRGMKR